VWRLAAAELDGYRRAYGLDHLPPAEHRGGRVTRDGRAAAPATAPTRERAGGVRGSAERRGRGEQTYRRGDLGRQPTVAGDQRHGADLGRLLGAEPRRDTTGRRRDWHTVWAALERLADHHHHRTRNDRHLPQERLGQLHGRDLGHQERDRR
jgi:hypothetical protein